MFKTTIVAAVAAAMVAASGFTLAQAPAGSPAAGAPTVKSPSAQKKVVKTAHAKKAKTKKVTKAGKAHHVAEAPMATTTRDQRMAEAKAHYDALKR